MENNNNNVSDKRHPLQTAFRNLNGFGLNAANTNKLTILLLIIARMEQLFNPYKESVCAFYDEAHDTFIREDLEEKIFDMIDGCPFFRKSRTSFLDILQKDEIKMSDLNYYFYGYDEHTSYEFCQTKIAELLLMVVDKSRHQLEFCYRTFLTYYEPLEWENKVKSLLNDSHKMADWARFRGSRPILSEIMASVIGCQVNADCLDIYDPACGFGGSLFTLHYWLNRVSSVRQVNIYGQDKLSAHAASLLSKVLLRQRVHIKLADSLWTDNYPNKQFDLIISDLPIKPIAPAAGFIPPLQGVDPCKDASLNFVNHIKSKLKAKGRAIFTLATSIFTSKSKEGYLSSLIDEDVIDAIILLPNGILYESSIAPCLCVIDKNKRDTHKGKIQVIDFSKLLADTGGFYDELGKNTIFQLHETMRKYENDTYSRIIDTRAMFQYDVAIKSPGGRTILNAVVPGDENDAIQYINYHYLTHMSGGEIDYSSITRCCGIDFGKLFVEEIEEPSFEEMEKETENIMRKVNSAFRKLLNEEMGAMMVCESEPYYKCMLMDVADITRYKTPITYREKLSFENIKENDVLVYNSKKGLAGKVARGGEELISKNAFCLKVNEHMVLPDYLYYLLKSREDEIADLAKESTLPSISASDLKALKIDLPSLYEQSKIVDQLKGRIDAVQELLPMLGGKAKETVEKYAAALIKETLGNK